MQTVVHLVTDDTMEQGTALNIAENLLDDETGSIDDVAVVAQSGGIEALTTEGEPRDRVQSLAADGVSFKACRNTMEELDLTDADLVDAVETVPEGAVEVTRLQNEGYGYVRP